MLFIGSFPPQHYSLSLSPSLSLSHTHTHVCTYTFTHIHTHTHTHTQTTISEEKEKNLLKVPSAEEEDDLAYENVQFQMMRAQPPRR